MPNNKDNPAQRDEHNRSFPIVPPIGDDIPFHDPTSIPKGELIKDPPVGDESPENQ